MHLALITCPSLSLVALSLPFPLFLTPDMKHPFPPHEIWRGPSWIVYRLAACMPMAAGGQAQVFRQAAMGEGWWWQGGPAPPNVLINLEGPVILACSILWGSFWEFSSYEVLMCNVWDVWTLCVNVHILRFVNNLIHTKISGLKIRWWCITSSFNCKLQFRLMLTLSSSPIFDKAELSAQPWCGKLKISATSKNVMENRHQSFQVFSFVFCQIYLSWVLVLIFSLDKSF